MSQPNHEGGPTTTFKNECSTQTSSILKRLPPELRIKIWKLLHKNDGPLNALPIHGVKTNDNDWYQYPAADLSLIELSGQALSCCQLFRLEAWAILYGANSLEIKFNKGTRDDHGNWLELLGIRLWYVPGLEGREGHCKIEKSLILRCGRTERDQWPQIYRLSKHFQSLSLVQNVRVMVGYSLPTDVYVACRIIRDLLIKKDVVFTIKPLRPTSQQNHDNRSVELEYLKSSRILRCRSITFESDLDLSSIIKEVTSDKPLDDLFPKYRNIVETIRDLPVINNRRFRVAQNQDGDTTMRDLQDAVMRGDATAANVYSSALLEKITQWNEDATEYHIATARRKYEDEINNLEDKRAKMKRRLEGISAEPTTKRV
ncbi:hypothetical protein PMZ80_005985 [Knufia obscura]|uniref:Uncharacterized protein n=1 Tax=Knufia obscura TaxID=1635080 RepID=A0ABR0RN36_9EURO|nr:hypothetical protein PMZ80_005985 [Knufia obscura]